MAFMSQRIYLSGSGAPPEAKGNLGEMIRRRMEAIGGGVELELPPREPAREPPDFGE